MKIESNVMAIEIKVPDIGDFKDVEIIELLVKPGDTVHAEQSLLTVESDKASMEIPSPMAGVIQSLSVKLGDKINQGDSLAFIVEAGGSAAASAAPAASVAVPAAASGASAAPVASVSAPVQAAASSGGDVTINVPDIGDFAEVEVIELLAAVGDTIALEQSLITVESDKASMEIPSSQAGVLKTLLVKIGDKVSKGTPLAVITAASAAGAATPAAASAMAVPATATPTAAVPAAALQPAGHIVSFETDVAVAPVVNTTTNDHIVKPHASPSVRKFARELGVELSLVRGTGPKMRVTQDDVRAYIKQAVQTAVNGPKATPAASGPTGSGSGMNVLPWPKVDFAKFGPIESQPLSRIKKISGPNLHRNWVMIPHVTQFDDADITELEAFRKSTNDALGKSGVKVTMLAFVMKACVNVLKKLPAFNGSLDESGENLIIKNYWNIGFAADTPNGLVVPVVKNVDQKGVAQIAKELGDLSALAREGKLKGADMQGATFTVSSLGGVGGTAFTPIINAPELAILGLSKSQIKPVWDGKQFVPRLMLPLSLSYDHRVIDGAQAAKFTTELASVLADMRKVLL